MINKPIKYLFLCCLVLMVEDANGLNANINDTTKVKFMMIDFVIKNAFSTDSNFKMIVKNSWFKIDDLNVPDFDGLEGFRKFKVRSDSNLALLVLGGNVDSIEFTIPRFRSFTSKNSKIGSFVFSQLDEFGDSQSVGTRLSDTSIRGRIYYRVAITHRNMEGETYEEVYINAMTLKPSQIILNAYSLSGRKLRDAYFYIE